MALDLPLDEAALACPSFEVLYRVARSYLPGALRLLKVPEDQIDDCIHDIVLAAHEGFTVRGVRLVPRGVRTEPLDMLKAWLSGIAFRHVSNHRRRASQRLELLSGDRTDFLASSVDEAPSSEQVAADVQRCRIMSRVLDRLPRDRADALVMFVVLEMTAPEIAEELGVNANTVKSRLARAHTDFRASAKRLSPDEQRTLESSALFVPVGLDSWSLIEDDPSWTSPPQANQGSWLGFAGAAMTALLFASGGALAARGQHAAMDATAIVAVHEPSLAENAAPSSASGLPVVSGSAETVRIAVRPSTPPPARGMAKAPTSDTLRRELVLIRAAQRAFDEGFHGQALDALAVHEQQFPLGVLAPNRERLAARTRAALAKAGAAAAP